jgi:hypothetical protein
MASYRPFRPAYARPARRLEPDFERPAPLTAAVVDAVLRFHDEEQDQGAGRTLLRLSPARLADVRATLGELAARAARVSILWNEREGEIIRVLEAA